jgi:hypothetical protein
MDANEGNQTTESLKCSSLKQGEGDSLPKIIIILKVHYGTLLSTILLVDIDYLLPDKTNEIYCNSIPQHILI